MQNQTEITSIDITFWNMTCIMVQMAFAAIPAMIIVAFVWMLIIAVISGM